METKKKIYKEKAQAKLDQMNAQIDQLIARFNESKAETKLKIKNQFEDLTSQQETAESKLDQMKDAGEDAWQDMRAGFDDAFDNLEDSFNKASRKLEEATS